MIRECEEPWTDTIASRCYTFEVVQDRCVWSGFSLKETMLVDKLLGDASLPRPRCPWRRQPRRRRRRLRRAHRAEELGEGRFELLRDQ